MKPGLPELALLGGVVASTVGTPYLLYRGWRHLDHEGNIVDRWCEYRGLQGERITTMPPERRGDSCFIIRFFPLGSR